MQIKMNRKGVKELLRSPEVEADLRARAERAANRHEGFEADSAIGQNRARASVRTATIEAALDEARGLELTRSIDSMR